MIIALYRSSSAALIAGALIAASLTGGSAAARIIGADDRIPLEIGLEAAFSGVGRLVCRDPATGQRFATTASLVGDRSTLLGVGHFGTVQGPDGSKAIPIDYCAFELRSANGKSLFGSLIAPEPVARFSATAEPSPYTADWAIFRLRTPAPDFAAPIVIKPTSARDLARQPGVFLVSYHNSPESTARTKHYSPDCRPSAVQGQPLSFMHSCDTQPGSSGALLYIMTALGPRAVGINHGSATGTNRNYGQVINREMVRNLPSQGIEGAP